MNSAHNVLAWAVVCGFAIGALGHYLWLRLADRYSHVKVDPWAIFAIILMVLVLVTLDPS